MTFSELYRMLERDGWYIHPVKKGMVVAGKHGTQEVPKGTLHRLLKISGLKKPSIQNQQVMKKRKITVIIEASSTGFGAHTDDDFPGIFGYAKTIPGVKQDFQEVIDAYLSYEKEKTGTTDPRLNNGDLEFTYKYDLESIFTHFGMLDITAFAKRVGMNPSLMRQYKSGLAKASDKQKKKIEEGLHELGRELQNAKLVYKKK